MAQTRIEEDALGQVALSIDTLYGINTFRALENFPLSKRSIAAWPDFIHAFSSIKQAAARANQETGNLTSAQSDAICSACEELKAGLHHQHLVVDMMEGSGGTSTNMNINEVIANIAAKSCGLPIHPNDHVNLGQSTNDVLPTAMKLGMYNALEHVATALHGLADIMSSKAKEHATVLRLGRTCLQDAQPMTLGQAFGGYEAVIRRHTAKLAALRTEFLTVPLGGTAIGTGFGSQPGYRAAVYRYLSAIFGVGVRPTANAFDGMQNMDACARLSAELRGASSSLWKIANDLIVLSSGPSGGIGEVTLPSVQAGSSIMPGKVNPVIPIAVCQAAFAVAGNDVTVAMACQQGLLEINHFEMVVCDRLFDSMTLLSGVARIFAHRCISGLVANAAISQKHLLDSSALATALVPRLGYAQVSRIVHDGSAQDRSFLDVAVGKGLIRDDDVMTILRASAGIIADENICI